MDVPFINQVIISSSVSPIAKGQTHFLGAWNNGEAARFLGGFTGSDRMTSDVAEAHLGCLPRFLSSFAAGVLIVTITLSTANELSFFVFPPRVNYEQWP